jgi:hypothetical protein
VKAKIAGIVILFWLSSAPSYSQILLGATAGGNFSWVSFGDKDSRDLYKVKPVWGYHAGAQLSFRVRKRFFLHTSLVYSTKGKILEGAQDLDLKVRYNYIEMPIAYTVNFKGNYGKKPFKYFLGVGPNISYWLGGKGRIENFDTHELASNRGEVKYKIVFRKDPFTAGENEMVVERPNRIQLGLNFTAGLVFEPARDREMFLTLRYELGHSYFSRESYGAFGPTFYEDDLKTRNQGFRISLAYLIDLKLEQRKKGKSTINRNHPK